MKNSIENGYEYIEHKKEEEKKIKWKVETKIEEDEIYNIKIVLFLNVKSTRESAKTVSEFVYSGGGKRDENG